MKNTSPSAVYVMEMDGRIKVGRAADPHRRRATLRSSAPSEINLLFATGIRDDGSLVESVAHKLLSAKRLQGEWFGVTAAEAIAAVNDAVLLVDAGLAETHPTSIRLSEDDKAELKLLAEAENRSVTNYIETLIKVHLAEKGRKVVGLRRHSK
jgi:hypothetical protein